MPESAFISSRIFRQRANKTRKMVSPLLFNPTNLPSLAAWYDVSDATSMKIDMSNRVSLLADKSGNSAVNCLVLNGSAGNYASSPDSAALDIIGDIDIRAFVSMNDWTPASVSYIVSKYNTSNNRSFRFGVSTGGELSFGLSSNGIAVTNVSSSIPTGYTDLTSRWIRATWRQSDGRVQFFTGLDGISWTQLGTDQSIVIGSIFSGTATLEIGSFDSGAASLLSGRVYRAQIYNGIAGTLVFDANFSLAAKLATSFTESSSNAATVTINTSGATGARISGERDLYQGTVANQPVYLPFTGSKYAYLNGTSGNYLSTPDSAALDITGDIDIRAQVSLIDWTPSVINRIVSKRTAAQEAYSIHVNTSGRIVFEWWDSTSTLFSRDSTVSPTIADGATLWIRVTLDVDNGASQAILIFYTSNDGVIWTQLGSTITITSTTSIRNTTAPLELGTWGTGTTQPMSGNFYRAQIYNGINGTLAFDFNPATYTTGSTLTDSSANAATITINGGAMIVTAPALYFDGSNDYLKAPPFALSQPETVNIVLSQATWTANEYFVDGGVNGISAVIGQPNAGSSPQVNAYAGTNSSFISTFSLKTSGLLSAVFSGASSVFRYNKNTAVTGNFGSATSNGITVGAIAAGLANWANFSTNEIAIYSTAQTTAQLDQFATYVASKWGFSV